MAALLANGPPLFPTPGAPAAEWAVWGACVSAAALLGGWAVRNRNRPTRDVPVGLALLAAFALVIGATVFAMHRHHGRVVEENRRAAILAE
jgi:hypothetical protein